MKTLYFHTQGDLKQSGETQADFTPQTSMSAHFIQGSFESKGSKFLAFLLPYTEFQSSLALLKQEHFKAVHFVSATRYFNEFNQILESFDDDGEPKGSSGMPSLNVLRGEELINIGVIVVRYFGGTLLGVGGLVRAYTNAVKNAIEVAKSQGLLQDFVVCESVCFEIAYPLLSQCEYMAKKLGVELRKESFLENGIKLLLQGEKDKIESVRAKFDRFKFDE